MPNPGNFACLDRRQHIFERMQTIQDSQIIRMSRLHAKTESVHTACSVILDAFQGHRSGVGFKRNFGILTADSDNLPPPEVIAQEIVDDLEAALEQFRLIAEDLRPTG